MNATNTLPIALIAVAFAGCATIVSDSSYPLAVSSQPEGAYFTVTNRDGVEINRGTTPESVELKAGSGYFKAQTYTITFSKDGFEEQTVSVRSSMDGWYWGNILIGGLIGMLIVDPITGAMYKLPESVHVNMDGSEAHGDEIAANPLDLEVLFASVDDLSDEQRALLQPVQ